ncbi:MAG TPA: amidohydrolase family protein [Euzebyales bacterium]|nr:amidohydrolase family protein [Euzebyales bacterium]
MTDLFETYRGKPWTTSRVPKPDCFVADVHAHVTVPEAAKLAAGHLDPGDDPRLRYADPRSSAYNRLMNAEVADKLRGSRERLADMDAMGIDAQLLSIAPPQYYYRAEPDLGAELARICNDRIAELAADAPERLVPMGTVPLQSPDAAAAELHRIGELGFPGIEIDTNVRGVDLDAPEHAWLWAEAERRGLTVILHPHGFSHAQRLGSYYLTNVVGLPLESTIAVSRLILSGTLERHPDLKLVVVHGGGFLSHYAARTDHAWEVRPETREHLPRRPSEYLRRVHFDTTTHSSEAVALLVARYGAEQVLLGTDYAFDMGETDPVALVTDAGLERDQTELVLGGNAARLLGIGPAA